jgi:hypothetical protein
VVEWENMPASRGSGSRKGAAAGKTGRKQKKMLNSGNELKYLLKAKELDVLRS